VAVVIQVRRWWRLDHALRCAQGASPKPLAYDSGSDK
jgi:hypothetical protein